MLHNFIIQDINEIIFNKNSGLKILAIGDIDKDTNIPIKIHIPNPGIINLHADKKNNGIMHGLLSFDIYPDESETLLTMIRIEEEINGKNNS